MSVRRMAGLNKTCSVNMVCNALGASVGRPAIFLDRDGVLNENRADYVRSWEQFAFLPGTFAAMRALSSLGAPIVVVTNQAGVGRGLIPTEAIDDIHQRMSAEIVSHGGRIEQILWCPHTVDDACDCRKPSPGMLVHAAEQLGIDLAASILVGDAETDIEAGRRAGCRTVLVMTGRGREAVNALATARRGGIVPDAVAADLSAAVPFVRQILPSVHGRQSWWQQLAHQQPSLAVDGLVSHGAHAGKG